MKKWLKIGTSLVLALAIIFIGISAYLGYTMTRVDRLPVSDNPGILGLSYDNVDFPSLDRDLTLRGWFLPVLNSERAIIIVHGNGTNRNDPSIGTLEIAGGLVKNGFNVLMFDLRGYGESDGSTVGGGYLEKRDLEGAVEYLKNRGFDRIGVIGFSLGAVTALLAGAENPNIDAVVSDSSYADLNDIMGIEFAKRTRAPSIFLRPILFMIKTMYGVDFAAIRPADGVAKIAPRPVLFIHGENDEIIPVLHASRLFAASVNPRDSLWIVPEAGHARSYKLHPEEYITRITDFFYSALE